MHGDGVSKCYLAEGGDSYATIPNEDQGLFTLERSNNSGNCTDVSRGIIPGILY